MAGADSSFEFPGDYYEIIRRDFRDLAAETAFFASYLPAQGHVLDIGCGTGTNLQALSELGHQCRGVDQSASFIDFAKGRGSSVTYTHSRAVDFEPAEQFDLVFCIFVTLNYMKRAELLPLFRKIRGWLRPEGHFVLDFGHMLNFADSYQPYIIAHHEHEGILLTRLIVHKVNPHEANWRHEETIVARDAQGGVRMYKNFFDQMILTAPEVRQLLIESGLTVVEEFSSFKKALPSATGRGHLIFVVKRSEADPER